MAVLLTLSQKDRLANAILFFQQGDVDVEQLLEKVIEIVEK